MADMSGDARAYPFFVRLGALMFAVWSIAALAGPILNHP